MRMIGELPERKRVAIFQDYLTSQQIACEVCEEEGTFEIWVQEEDDVARAELFFAEFQNHPDDKKYLQMQKQARRIRVKGEKKARVQPIIDGRTSVFYRGAAPMGMVTGVLIMACVAVTFFSRFGRVPGITDRLFISSLESPIGLPEIFRGEVWRLFTPILLHFDFLHILFNLMWLFDLGNMVEDRKGSLFLLVFILATALVSNLAQYVVSGPAGGGMSGVVYGLVGYIWMKGRYDPSSHLGLNRTVVVMMFLWYFLCFFGLRSIGNAAHTAGLVMGTVWGFAASARREDFFLIWRRRKSRLLLIFFILFLAGLIVYHVFFDNIFLPPR